MRRITRLLIAVFIAALVIAPGLTSRMLMTSAEGSQSAGVAVAIPAAMHRPAPQLSPPPAEKPAEVAAPPAPQSIATPAPAPQPKAAPAPKPVRAASKPSTSDAGGASGMLSLVNQLRASRGLAPLVVDGALAANAQQWAAHLASAGALSHQSIQAGTLGMGARGENVGSGGSVAQIERMLENSPGHLANLTNGNFNRIGIGIVKAADGSLYAVQEFGHA